MILSEQETKLVQNLEWRCSLWPLAKWMLVIFGVFLVLGPISGYLPDSGYSVGIGVFLIAYAITNWLGNPVHTLVLKLIQEAEKK